jgi:hypothetical protein
MRSLCSIMVIALLFATLSGCKPSTTKSSAVIKSSASADNSASSETSSNDSSGVISGSSLASGASSNKANQSSGSKASSSVGSSSRSTSKAKYNFVFGTFQPTQFQQGSDDLANIYAKQIADVEKSLNCTITIKPFEVSTMTDDIYKTVMSGSKVADVINVTLASARNLARKGALIDQKTVKNLNLSSGNFDKAGTDSVTFNGKVYASAVGALSTYSGVFFNKNLIKKYASQYDVDALYNNGTWTWENFEAIAKATTVKADSIWGMANGTQVIGFALTSNSGGTAIKVNNQIKMVMCDQTGIDALTWMKKLYSQGNYKYTPNWKDSETLFTSGKAALFPFFLYAGVNDIGPVVEFDYGFVPFPKGPAQGDYKSSLYDCSVFVIPKNISSNDLANTGSIYNALSAVTPKTVSTYIQKMKDAGMDATSVSAYNWLRQNTIPDFSSGIDGLSTYSPQVDNSVLQSVKQPASVIAGIKVSMQKACDDYYNGIK